MGDAERSQSKKLTEAGRNWYGGKPPPTERPAVDDNVLEGMRRMGATQAQIDEVAASWAEPDEVLDDDSFEVWDDNWESVMFFVGLETQWSYAAGGMGKPRLIGLPSPCIESDMNMRQIARKARPALLADLRVMEKGALAAQAEHVQQQRGAA